MRGERAEGERRSPAELAKLVGEYLGEAPKSLTREERIAGTSDLVMALHRFRDLLPEAERPGDCLELLQHVESSNAWDARRLAAGLPTTLVFRAAVHPSYFSGPGHRGAEPWRIAYTDGGPIGASQETHRFLDEAIRMAEARHDTNPFAEVPFDGGGTVILERRGNFQAISVIYGELDLPSLNLAHGGVRYHPLGRPDSDRKQSAIRRWGESSLLAGMLGQRLIAGPDLRTGGPEMSLLEEAAATLLPERVPAHPLASGLGVPGSLPWESGELAGWTLLVALEEALLHPGLRHYGFEPGQPVSVIVYGFEGVGAALARSLVDARRRERFRVRGLTDSRAALYRSSGIDPGPLLRLRTVGRSLAEHRGTMEALWMTSSHFMSRRRTGFRGTDLREILEQPADVVVLAGPPGVVDAAVAGRIRARLVIEGTSGSVAPGVEGRLAQRRILYLPAQAVAWGESRAATFEVVCRELCKRSVSMEEVEERVRRALAPLGSAVSQGWVSELLRTGLRGVALAGPELPCFVSSLLEDLARGNTRWLLDELVASRHERTPLEIVRVLARSARALKVQLLSLLERGLGGRLLAAPTCRVRLRLAIERRREHLLVDGQAMGLTSLQLGEERQMLREVERDVSGGLSPVLAALLAAQALARQKVLDPESYAEGASDRDVALLRDRAAGEARRLWILQRFQRVQPVSRREELLGVLRGLVDDPSEGVVLRRNAALALGHMGAGDGESEAALRAVLADPDVSLAATSRWVLYQLRLGAGEGAGLLDPCTDGVSGGQG